MLYEKIYEYLYIKYPIIIFYIKFGIISIIGAAALVITVVVFLPIGRHGVALVLDAFQLRKAKKKFSPERKDIAAVFLRFRTPRGRLFYADWLELATFDFADHLRDPGNCWPQGVRPQIDGDPGSVKLAQLDARWLDIE